MDAVTIVALVCVCIFNIAAGQIYVPPVSRTVGVTRWYLHYDEMCYFDALKQCQQLYKNGRLLVLESDGMRKILSEKIGNITATRTTFFYVGLYGSGNLTHNAFRWSTCSIADVSELLGIPPWWFRDNHCSTYTQRNARKGYFHLWNCDTPRPYACEEMTTEQACDMDGILNTDGDSFGCTSEANCDWFCQKLSNCWGTLYINGQCTLLKNTEECVSAKVVMKRKNCVKEVLETSVGHSGGNCNATSPECSSQSTIDYSVIASTQSVFMSASVSPVNINHSDVRFGINTNPSSTRANRSDICTPIVNYTSEQLAEKINEIVKELKVNKSETSARLRTLNCAKDDRPSAKTVGAFGLVFIIAPFVVMFISDIPTFMKAGRALLSSESSE